jgi:coenzyme F420-dependent glucose-6-phosphate dehydrogenase
MKTKYGFHASHEQFTPKDLVAWVVRAEQAGFDSIMSSDHCHPWSERQGQSGFSFSWLGAAMQATSLPFGVISAPGYRYHLALGSGEAINEAITGLPWPEKAERNARLLECAQIIRALLEGETVTHRGRVDCIEAKLYTRPNQPISLIGGACTEKTAEWLGSWADGMVTVHGENEQLQKVIDAFRRGGGEGKPIYLQVALSFAKTEEEAVAIAIDQWGPNSIGGEVNWDLRRPKDFDQATQYVSEEQIRKSVFISSDLGAHRQRLSEFAAMGFEEVILHHVGRDQENFIDTFGEKVLPTLR